MTAKIILVILLLVIALFAWAPWMTAGFVDNSVTKTFNNSWGKVQDGYALIKVANIRKNIFGSKADISYGGGFSPATESKEIFVSSFGHIFGFPRP